MVPIDRPSPEGARDWSMSQWKIVDKGDALERWVGEAFRYAVGLPAKHARKSRPAGKTRKSR
jgi:hypothetical protein